MGLVHSKHLKLLSSRRGIGGGAVATLCILFGTPLTGHAALSDSSGLSGSSFEMVTPDVSTTQVETTLAPTTLAPFTVTPKRVALKKGSTSRSMASLRINTENTKPKSVKNLSMRIPETNASYLQSTRVQKQDDWSSDWLDNGNIIKWRSQVESQILRNDRQSQAGLLNSQEKREQSEALHGLSQSAFNDMTRLFTQAQLNRLKKNTGILDSGFRDPLIITIFFASTLTGRELKLRAANWITIRSRTYVQQRTSRLSLQTARIDTVVAYHDPGSDRMVSAQFLTRLDPNWSAGYDTSNSGTWKVQYGVTF